MGRILRDGVPVPRHQGSNGSRRPFVVAPSRERFATVEGLSATLDAVLAVAVDDRVFAVSVHVVDYGTGRTATRPVRLSPAPGDTLPMLVADRITAEARHHPQRRRLVLARSPWLHVRAPGVRVDLAVPSAERATASTAGPAINRAIRHHHRVLVERAPRGQLVAQPRVVYLGRLCRAACALWRPRVLQRRPLPLRSTDCPRDRAT